MTALGIVSAATAASARPRPLAQMSPEMFARMPDLHEPLDAATIDHGLLAAALFHETNRVRRQHGLRAFAWLAKLDAAADLQANSGALDQAAGHINVFPSLLTVADRLDKVGLRRGRAAENTALLPLLNLDPTHGIRIAREDDREVVTDGVTGRAAPPHTYASFAAAALQAWMNSPGHRANVLNPKFQSLGCSGRATKRIASVEMIACVQVFYSRPTVERTLP